MAGARGGGRRDDGERHGRGLVLLSRTRFDRASSLRLPISGAVVLGAYRLSPLGNTGRTARQGAVRRVMGEGSCIPLDALCLLG